MAQTKFTATDDDDEDEWPICKVEGCEEEYPPARKRLGYDTCLKHGDKPKEFTVAPAFNKGGYQLITASNVRDIGKAK